MWNETFRLPVPPVDAVAPTLFSAQCTVFYGVFAVAAFLFSLKHWRDTRRPILLLILIGGGLTVFVEPFLDLMGAAFHPRFGQTIVFEFMGRPIPWWMVAAYFAYFGALGSMNYIAFSKGISMRAMRLWFLVPMIVDVLIEETMLAKNLYLYYGEQPLILFWKLPLWWVPCNSLGEFIGICSVVLIAPHLQGWRLLLVPLLIPMADMIGYGAIALPSWIVINTPVAPWAVQLGGILTFLLAFLTVHGLSLVVATDSPLKMPTARQDAKVAPTSADGKAIARVAL